MKMQLVLHRLLSDSYLFRLGCCLIVMFIAYSLISNTFSLTFGLQFPNQPRYETYCTLNFVDFGLFDRKLW